MNKQLYSIQIHCIDVGERLRPVDPDYVALLAASMAERGQDTPIVISSGGGPNGNHRLIAGAHRLAAAQSLGWEEIEALVSDAEGLEADLLEVDENLMRRELSALDRAVFLARRKEIYEQLHPETKHGGKRPKGQVDKDVHLIRSATFSRATAAKLGIDRRTVDRAITRAALPADIRAAIATHPVADSGAELDKLLAQPAEIQRQVVAALTRAEAPARAVTAALAEIAGPAKTSKAAETQKQLSALLTAWRKAGKPARGQFLDWLESEGKIPERKGRAA